MITIDYYTVHTDCYGSFMVMEIIILKWLWELTNLVPLQDPLEHKFLLKFDLMFHIMFTHQTTGSSTWPKEGKKWQKGPN